MLDIRLIQSFVAVAEQLSFTKAASRLYISQPALSQQITELENSLGTSLFVRTKRSIVLTPAGEMLLEEGRELIKNINEIEKRVTGSYLNTDNVTSLFVGLTTEIFHNHMIREQIMQTLQQMRSLYTHLGIKIEVFSSSEIDNKFSAGMDIAVTFADYYTPKRGSFSNPIGMDYYGLMSSANINPEELGNKERFEMYLPQYDSVLFQIAKNVSETYDAEPEIIFSNSVEVIRCLLESGIYGATIVARGAWIPEANPNLRLIPLPEVPEFSAVPIVVWNNTENTMIKKFMELLRGLICGTGRNNSEERTGGQTDS